MNPDAIIPVRPGDNNEELRFTLRCLEANLPHNEVWIVGYQPTWVTNVQFIPGNGHQGNNNVYRNILAACEHPDVPDEFIVFNDDFLVTEPVTQVPVWHHGSLSAQVAGVRRNPKTWWHKSLLLTLDTLRHAGYRDPISYEIHCPLPVRKAGMAAALREFINIHKHNIPVQWRTVYGVLNDIGGVQHTDCKARHRGGEILTPFHSTADSSWRWYRRYFETHYPQPSRYEKVT